MGIDYVKINIKKELPDLWEYYKSNLTINEMIGSNSFNNFLKREKINGYAVTHDILGTAFVRTDHYVWIKLKYQ